MSNHNTPKHQDLEIGDVKEFVTGKKTFVAEVSGRLNEELILDPLFDHEVEEYAIFNNGTVWESRYPSGDQIESEEEDLGKLQEINPTEDESVTSNY